MRKAELASSKISEKSKEKDGEKENTTGGEKGEGKGKEKHGSEDEEDLFRVNAKAQMGEIEEARCSARLVYDNDVKHAEAKRLEFDAEDGSAIITLAFTVNEGVDGMFFNNSKPFPLRT